MFRIRHAILATALLGVAQQAAAVTVGSETACDFHSLNDAINSVPRGGTVSIRLSNNLDHDSLLSIDRNVNITGGYDSCTDGSANHLTPSVIRGIGNNQPTVHLSGFANPLAVNVSLTNVNIVGGAAPNGAGIRITADNRVTLSNVKVYNNVASVTGGGVYIDGSKGAELVIDYESQIYQNSAHQKGGGIYCVNASAANNGLIDFRRGEIRDNLAGAYGAGLFLDNCKVTGATDGLRRIADNFADLQAFDDEILDLNSRASGGGIYAVNDSRIHLGSVNSETLIEDNHVRHEIYDGFGFHYEEDHGEGGGLYLTSSATAYLVNTHVAGNLARTGGAARITDGGYLDFRRHADGCVPSSEHPGCASLDDNTAQGYDDGSDSCIGNGHSFSGRGGALAVSAGYARLNGVWVSRNRAVETDGCLSQLTMQYPHGAAFLVDEGGFLETFNTVIHDNGNNSADDIIHVDDSGSEFFAYHSTIAGNSNVDDAVIRTGGRTDLTNVSPSVGLFNSIIMESAAIYKNDHANAGRLTSICVLANNLGTLDDAPQSEVRDSLQAGSAGFVDGNNDNFRLQDNSPAVDLCTADELAAANRVWLVLEDMDGADRPRIASADPDHAWDAGAYENQSGLEAVIGDLEVTIDDGGFNIGLNSSMGYLITLQNNGPNPVANAGFRVTLDAALQNVMTLLPFANGWTCSNVGHIGECQYSGTLPPGSEPLEVAVQFTSPSSPAIVTSTVEALGPATLVDTVTSNSSASEVTSIATDSDLATRFVTVPSVLEPGESSQVTVELENLGPDVSPQPKIRLFFPDTVQNVSVINKPSTAWSCTGAVDMGDGTAAITCSANQAGPTAYGFTFGFQVPINQSASSLWAMRLVVVQEATESIANNLAETSIPVEVLSGGPVIFRGDFED
ncbi:MAG: hypothetical protein R3F22_02845 [Lysobacteraceae bacterium]